MGRHEGQAPAQPAVYLPLPPSWGMAVGALFVSSSAILVDISGASPGTASFYRSLLAWPPLAVLAELERRRHSAASRRGRLVAAVAGALFAGDMLLWTQAILEVGAGLSTVLVNTQVVIVPLLAWLVDRERVGRLFLWSLPVMLAGIVLTGGVLEHGVAARDPFWGTIHAVLAAVCYSGFLFLLRRGGQAGAAVQTYRDVIAAAALVSLAIGMFWHGVSLLPGWASIGWLALVALCGQVAGWLLVALATPHLPSEIGAALLMLTPIGALLLGATVLGEHPTVWQLVGCALLLGSAYWISTGTNPLRRLRRTQS